MDKVLTIEGALELENHFIIASRALKCAYRNMKRYKGFKTTCREVANASLVADNAAAQMRQLITDNA